MPLFWPWWLGGALLALVTVGCCVVARRPLGVSGIMERMVNIREELAVERRNAVAAAAGAAALEAALLAATAEAFGTSSGAEARGGTTAAPSTSGATPLPLAVTDDRHGTCAEECASAHARPTVSAHAMFLASIVAGAFLVRMARGGWTLQMDLGPTFERVVGTGVAGALVLALGGVLVGLGTSISGGCSTGHGLSGCSRVQPAGVAATLAFMAAAVAVSFLLAWRIQS